MTISMAVIQAETQMAKEVHRLFLNTCPLPLSLFWVRIPMRQLRFGTLAIPLAPLCQCLSEETIKAVGPFYLVSMPGEVNDPTQGVNV